MENRTGTKVKEAVKVDPSHIMQVGMGFWASKILLTAVKLELFTLLAEKPASAAEIKQKLCIHDRSLYDFLDSLVALGFLKRTGIKQKAVYSNSADSDFFLDKNKLSYTGGMLEMANNRLYPFWNFLEEGLKRGTPQNEIRTGESSLFEKIYSDKDKTREFVNAMGGVQAGNFITFATRFDFSEYSTLCDIGGAGAQLSAQVAIQNPHMRWRSYRAIFSRIRFQKRISLPWVISFTIGDSIIRRCSSVKPMTPCQKEGHWSLLRMLLTMKGVRMPLD